MGIVGLSDERQRQQAARQLAWEDAVAKATQLAELAGVSLGPVLAVSETTTPGPRQAMAADAAEAAPPIEPGTVTTSISITVRFSVAG